MTIGFRIMKRRRKVQAALVERFHALPVANVSDCMSRMAAAGPALRPLHRNGKLAGVALTVKTRPGDNLLLHKAIDLAEPGDVIVVDGGGDLTTALMGEIMLYLAVARGVAGFVINGAVRDLDEIRRINLPLYAAGITHRGPYKDGPGEINVPIAISGMVIEPGDLIIGDADGVLAVPAADAEAVLAAAEMKQSAEEKEIAAIHAGTIDRRWVDAALVAKGCKIEA
ncbi:RraA family protein [Reyranella sp. CPCC 100927]|uniref:RraA family protein n=1 Tax=Reyranella sp. CPCC 100927 TaxID=2599616 RepID=UPI0011B53A1E|nr:RraA family protein [Reyranella sp. CPCC 100927]TWT10260.1 RraA family protein [Reyranella sp. CPCC 100927]